MTRSLRKVLGLSIVALVAVLVLQAGVAAQTLEFYSMWNKGEPQEKVLSQIFEDFKAETGVTVRPTWAGREILTKARPRLLMGNPPDVLEQSFSELWAALLARDELVLPLNDLLEGPGPEGDGRFADLFAPDFLNLYARNGKYYFVPYEYITSGFFYNKTLFAKYGLEVPTTWSELLDVAKTLKENGEAAFVQDNDDLYNAYWYYWAVERTLGPGALYRAATDRTGATWDEPGYLEAAKMVETVSAAGEDYFLKGYQGSVWPAGQVSWGQGNGAMILVGSWIVNEVAPSASPDWDPGFFAFPPVRPDGPNTMEAYLIGWAIPKKAKNQELAKQLIRFALQEKYQEMIAEVAQNVPARSGVGYPKEIAGIQPYVENADGFHVEYDFTQARIPQWFSTLFGPLGTRLLHGDLTAEAFIGEIKAKTIEYWKAQ
ncbi:ABC transporter substrate-binding protein [Limnochorda pilosa]|uniref:ABC transporter substrate-binding protein n=1 Tax=Limnochorda pilosa TaxID=1555112 RepID=A0A0K2SM54_LIMPI|nr:ABC transporter substrate-binding protein [Limnochorda pilosa]BAS27914.1 ABC transporter substrate-binding protein [Limnochorda pilosa]